MKYLLNTNSKTIHLANSKDGRCRIKSMREEYKTLFSSLQEALDYPSKEHPLGKKCKFCLSNETSSSVDQ